MSDNESIDCPVCSSPLDVDELHLGIIYCPRCEANGRSFDIDTGSKAKTSEILEALKAWSASHGDKT